MKRFYSSETGCTYLENIHSFIPANAVLISEDRYKSVIANPAPGKVRGHDTDGLPILIDPPAPDLAEQERYWRDNELSSVIWLRDRHRDQLDLGTETALTPERFAELLAYMQTLRDWPQLPDFPDSQHRPTAPAWIAEQTE